jgi:hypothetical protein
MVLPIQEKLPELSGKIEKACWVTDWFMDSLNVISTVVSKETSIASSWGLTCKICGGPGVSATTSPKEILAIPLIRVMRNNNTKIVDRNMEFDLFKCNITSSN